MSEPEIFDAMRQVLWVSVLVSLPMLGAALIIGLVVGFLQAMTSVQEMTLTFVPKMAGMILAFWLTMSFMSGRIISLFNDLVLVAIEGK